MESVLEKLFEKHKDWINIVESFGSNKENAEDIVSEMYYKIGKMISNGTDISYGNDINHFYIFRTLTSIYLDKKRKDNKNPHIYFEELHEFEKAETTLDYSNVKKEVDAALEQMYWYDQKVFDIINSGESIASLSRKTNISYYSLYNTYNKVREKLEKILWNLLEK